MIKKRVILRADIEEAKDWTGIFSCAGKSFILHILSCMRSIECYTTASFATHTLGGGWIGAECVYLYAH